MAKFFIINSFKNFSGHLFLYGSFGVPIILYLINNLLHTDNYYLSVILFTIYQAILSSLLSIVLSLFFLRTVYKFNKSPFGWLVNRLIDLPFFLPSLIGCLSIVMIFGNNGIIGKTLRYFGFSYQTFIYGIGGIVICHLFYYVPYALRILLTSLASLPPEYDRLSATLNIKDFTKIRVIYYPLLKDQLYGLFISIFTYCFRSFTIILIFGGLPSTTTIEVALYQLLNFDFDLKTAIRLSIVQILINAGLFFSQSSYKKNILSTKTKSSYIEQKDNLKTYDLMILLIIGLLFIFPILSVIIKGMPVLPSIIVSHHLWWSVLTSSLIGIFTSIFSFCLLFPLVYISYSLTKNNKNRFSFLLSEVPANLSAITSPLIIIAIFYVLFSEKINNIYQFMLVISCLNAICFLPVMYRALKYNYTSQRRQYDQLCKLLNIRGLKRFFLIDWLSLKSPIGYCLTISFVFSIGDSRSILFFNNSYFDNLISLLYDKMRVYLFEEAAAIACFILFLSFFFSFIIEHILGRYNRG